MRALPLLCCLAVLSACKTAPETAPEDDVLEAGLPPRPKPLTPPSLRLPPNAKPLSYALDLRVVPGEDTFTGTLTLELEALAPLDVLWLNATALVPAGASFMAQGQAIGAQTKVFGEHFLAVKPERPLAPGKATLTIAYAGTLSRKSTGGVFQVREGELDYAYTHFEPLDARRAFPGFDEPHHKVPFTLTLHVKKEHLAFANTPIASEAQEPNGMKAITFAPTKPLPTYLLAFAVGPYEVVEAGAWGQKKTPVRIIVPQGKKPQAAWAVASTGPILEQLETWFGSPYPFEKLDQISVQVATGAMENPGLVTYGHQLILAKPTEDTPSRQRAYAHVCAHELAHQWFGDLVTMAWWDDLWLNEAFATWMANKTIIAWKPEWGAQVGQVQTRSNALGMDGLVSARQVRQPIQANDDVSNAFDGITYSKGASVLATFEQWVGPTQFQQGVQQYLAKHAYGTATAQDFLAELSQAAGKDVSGPLSSFLDQAGAPKVRFTLVCSKTAPPKLELTQERQLPIGSKGDAAQQWKVPVCVRYGLKGKESRACTLLQAPKGELVLEQAKGCPDWVLPNDGMLGHYRSTIGGDASLSALLEKGGPSLSVPERVGVLGDLSAMVGTGEVDMSVALNVVPLAAKEKNRHLLELAMGLARWPGDDFLPETLKPKHQAFIRQSFGAKAKQLGFTVGAKDDEDTRLLRSGVLYLVGKDGQEPELRAQAVKLANQWLSDRKSVSGDVIDVVLAIAGDTGDAALHAALLDAVKKEQDRVDRSRMLGGLASYRVPALVQAQLPLVLSNELDPRESMRLVWGAAQDARTRDLALAFVKTNWNALLPRLPEHAGASLVNLAAGVCDEQGLTEVKSFFDGRSTKIQGGPRQFAAAIERIELCVAFRARQRPSAIEFFERLSPPTVGAPHR